MLLLLGTGPAAIALPTATNQRLGFFGGHLGVEKGEGDWGEEAHRALFDGPNRSKHK